MNKLSRDEVQLCMHFLDLASLLNMACCSKRLYDDADSKAAWKCVADKVCVRDWPLIPETTLVRHHKALTREGYDIYRRIPGSISACIHELTVQEGWGMARESVAAIVACCNITKLRLIFDGYATMSSNAMLEAVSSCKRLRELHIRHCWRDTGSTMWKLLGKCPYIHTLDVAGSHILSLLEGFPDGHNVRTLRIHEQASFSNKTRQIRVLADVLRSPSLTSFTYYAPQVSGMNWAEFSEFIKEAPNLTSLDLSDNRIDKDGAIILCAAAQRSKTLQHLVLKKNTEQSVIDGDYAAELVEKNGKAKFTLLV